MYQVQSLIQRATKARQASEATRGQSRGLLHMHHMQRSFYAIFESHAPLLGAESSGAAH